MNRSGRSLALLLVLALLASVATAQSVRIRDDITYAPNEYTVNIRGVKVAGGEIQPKSLMVIDPGYAEGEIEGTDTTEPAFGLPAKWIAPAQQEQAEMLGFTVVEPPAVLATLLSGIYPAWSAGRVVPVEAIRLV